MWSTQTEGHRLALSRKYLSSDLWLVGWSRIHSFTSHYRSSTHQDRSNQLQHIKKKQRQNARPQCLVDWALHCSAEHAAISSQPTTAPASATIIHRGPPARLSRACKWYILAHSWQNASSLDSSPALHRSEHHWGELSSRHKTKHGILATALRENTT